MGEQRVSLRIQWVAVEEMWFIERICTCSNIYIYFDQSGMAMMRPWRSRSFEVHSNSIQNRGGFFGKILSQKFFVLSSSWFAIKVITNKYSYLTPSYLELFVSLIWTIHRKIQQSRFYECNVNLLIDFSKFVQWLHHVPSDTLPLEIGVRGRPRHISRTGIRMLSTGSYRQLVPSGWIVQYFSNIADLQIRIQFDLPTTSVQPSSNVCLSFFFSLPPLLSIDAISLEGLMQTKHHSPLIEAG